MYGRKIARHNRAGQTQLKLNPMMVNCLRLTPPPMTMFGDKRFHQKTNVGSVLPYKNYYCFQC